MKREFTVDVWVGMFESEERMERYLEELYDDDDSTPLSEFAGAMNEFFYDHDFFESSFHETPTDDLDSALREHSIADSGIGAVVAAFANAPEPFNAILLMWNGDDDPQIKTPVSVQKEGANLNYLGRFDGPLRR